MTDLDKHVNQPGRAKLVKQVRAKINELGIEYIFFQFISVTGRVVGKGIPTDHWERTCEKGFVNFLGIKKSQEYLLLVLETEKKEKTQEHI